MPANGTAAEPMTPATQPKRFTRAERDLFKAGRCYWGNVISGTVPGSDHCGRVSAAPSGYCAGHEQERLSWRAAGA